MTFLEMVKALRRETSVSGEGPAAVTGQTGEMGRLVAWILQADNEIQTYRVDWNFLWKTGAFSTIASQGLYDLTLAADMGGAGNEITDFNLFENFDPNIGKGPKLFVDSDQLIYLPWGQYDPNSYGAGETKPYDMTIRPDGKWLFLPTPDIVFAITFNYYSTPVVMVDNADVSVIPVIYHDIVVSRAMMYYAEYEDAPELMSAGAERYDQLMDAMRATQLPGQEAFNRSSYGDIVVVNE